MSEGLTMVLLAIVVVAIMVAITIPVMRMEAEFWSLYEASKKKRETKRFSGESMVERVDGLEKKLNATSKLLEEFVRWFREAYGI